MDMLVGLIIAHAARQGDLSSNITYLNAAATQTEKVFPLRRRVDEIYRTFIETIDNNMAFLKSLGGEQSDYVRNSLLHACADLNFKTAVILGVEAKKSYEEIRDKCLRVLPYPAHNGREEIIAGKRRRWLCLLVMINLMVNQNQNQKLKIQLKKLN